MARYFFFALIIASCFLSPAIALLAGVIFAFLFTPPFPKQTKIASKYLLQISVVGLGFGINLHESLKAGTDGMLFTILSVTGIMVIGYLLGRLFKLPVKLSYLISSGTAICGGSAIAAISPVVKANESETSISLAVIFTLNAVALFIFPPIGKLLGLSQTQFGTWAAIAIHDTSSVIGAGAEYGETALNIATMVKLTRALWIIPLSLISVLLFKKNGNNKIAIPWFIFLFILAMLISTYIPLPNLLLKSISLISHKLLSITLFLIGSTLSFKVIKDVGIKPVLSGIVLWIIISITSLIIIL